MNGAPLELLPLDAPAAAPPPPAEPPPAAPAVAPRELPQAPRLRAFFSNPVLAIDQLGRLENAGRATLDLLDAIGRSTRRLNEANRALVPLIEKFREPGSARRWWRWFVGETLERELSFSNVCAEIESGAHVALDECETARRTVAEIAADRVRIDGEVDALEADIAFGKMILSDRCRRLREATREPEQTWQRLSRRVGNLEAMATSLRLTQAQYGVAIEHARTIVDRTDEIRTLLMPIWYQRMGFELFARRADAGPAGNSPEKR